MKLFTASALAAICQASVYMHNPRGSNNRLNERSAQNKVPTRLFQANNNRRGGYNVGDKTDKPFTQESQQYAMKYFQSGNAGASYLTVEWTQLLGCGSDQDGDKIHNCQIVLQSMCQDDETGGNAAKTDSFTLRNGRRLEKQGYQQDPNDAPDPQGRCFRDSGVRDLPRRMHNIPAGRASSAEHCKAECARHGYLYAGNQFRHECFCGNTFGRYGEAPLSECNMKCQDKAGAQCGGSHRQNIYRTSKFSKTGAETQARKNARRQQSTSAERGLHEPWEFYDRCHPASNGTGERHGLECEHERNTYPYNKISPWTDVAVMTDDAADCQDYIHVNHRGFEECVEFYDAGKTKRKHKSKHVDKTSCEKNGGVWEKFYRVHSISSVYDTEAKCKAAKEPESHYVWGRPMSWKDLAADKLSPKQCILLPPKTVCQKTPVTRHNYLGNSDPSGSGLPETPKFLWKLPRYLEDSKKRCVLRLRFMIDSDDTVGIDHANNDFQVAGTALKLAVSHRDAKNNAVVFEDRSHVFQLTPRKSAGVPDELVIHNINVRGKRGNIVQTFPAVEYDFVPNRLTITEGEAVHVQWTGSNTHNNGNPAGDGQAGDAGEGRGGTDRNNLIPMMHRKLNFPMPYENHTLFHNADWVWSSHKKGNAENESWNLALSYATAGYYHCKDTAECGNMSFQSRKNSLNDRLDNAPASYYGHVFVPATGDYHYKCLRNDNFSNRSQKGSLYVKAKSAAGAVGAMPSFGSFAVKAIGKRSVRNGAGRDC